MIRTLMAATAVAALLSAAPAISQTYTVIGDTLANAGFNPATTAPDPLDASVLKVGVTHPGIGNAAIVFRARSAGPTSVTDRLKVSVDAATKVTAKVSGVSYISRMGDTGAGLILEAGDETDTATVGIGVIGNRAWSRELVVYPDEGGEVVIKLYATVFATCSITSCSAQNTITSVELIVE